MRSKTIENKPTTMVRYTNVHNNRYILIRAETVIDPTASSFSGVVLESTSSIYLPGRIDIWNLHPGSRWRLEFI